MGRGSWDISLLVSYDLLHVLPHDNLTDTSGLWVAQRGLSQALSTNDSDLPSAPLPHHLLVELIRHNWRESEAEASGAK